MTLAFCAGTWRFCEGFLGCRRFGRVDAGVSEREAGRWQVEVVAGPCSTPLARQAASTGPHYAGGFSGGANCSRDDLLAFCDAAIRRLDDTIRANRRDDGLYHGYNLIRVEDETIVIRRLPEMLEGQMAVLSSGALSVENRAAAGCSARE